MLRKAWSLKDNKGRCIPSTKVEELHSDGNDCSDVSEVVKKADLEKWNLLKKLTAACRRKTVDCKPGSTSTNPKMRSSKGCSDWILLSDPESRAG